MVRAAVSEITDESNAPEGKSRIVVHLRRLALGTDIESIDLIAFALYGLVWIIGSILGNAIGGYLSHPVERYPNLFARGGKLEEHPYLLPCLVTTGITLAGLLFTALFMKEVGQNRECAPHPSRSGLLTAHMRRPTRDCCTVAARLKPGRLTRLTSPSKAKIIESRTLTRKTMTMIPARWSEIQTRPRSSPPAHSQEKETVLTRLAKRWTSGIQRMKCNGD